MSLKRVKSSLKKLGEVEVTEKEDPGKEEPTLEPTEVTPPKAPTRDTSLGSGAKTSTEVEMQEMQKAPAGMKDGVTPVTRGASVSFDEKPPAIIQPLRGAKVGLRHNYKLNS